MMLTYIIMLSEKKTILDAIDSTKIDMEKQSISKTFNFISKYDVDPKIPWFARNGKRT